MNDRTRGMEVTVARAGGSQTGGQDALFARVLLLYRNQSARGKAHLSFVPTTL